MEKMNLNPLFEQQEKTMQMYEEKHPTKKGEDRNSKRILALLVEVGELANETRCFKFWSDKPSSEKEVVLEEYVDGLHFVLELGVVGEWHKTNIMLEIIEFEDLVEAFLDVYKYINEYQYNFHFYTELLENYIGLGSALGFTWEEIESAYWAKNKINYERQEQGY